MIPPVKMLSICIGTRVLAVEGFDLMFHPMLDVFIEILDQNLRLKFVAL